MQRILTLGFVAAAAAGLSGCVVSQVHNSADFGAAARQDLVAQIADPDRSYAGPPPPSNGAVAVLAQTRYRTGRVIPPVATASDIGISSQGAPPEPAPAAAAPTPGS